MNHCPECGFTTEIKVIDSREYAGCQACEWVAWTGRIVRNEHPAVPRYGEMAKLYRWLEDIAQWLEDCTEREKGELINERGRVTGSLWQISRKQKA